MHLVQPRGGSGTQKTGEAETHEACLQCVCEGDEDEYNDTYICTYVELYLSVYLCLLFPYSISLLLAKVPLISSVTLGTISYLPSPSLSSLS